MATDFMIGATEGGMVTLKSLGVLNPKSDFQEFARLVDTGDGGRMGQGLGKDQWTWGFIPEADVDILETYCPNRVSNTVYIATQINGTDFGVYRAKVLWPEKVEFTVHRALDFSIAFRLLEAL